ncbi:MAG TPA: hypothetical protein VGP79_11235 [Bryobacteraceae bacterium]|nr:hypothetical protein [Bryobacteraceae bacterium]
MLRQNCFPATALVLGIWYFDPTSMKGEAPSLVPALVRQGHGAGPELVLFPMVGAEVAVPFPSWSENLTVGEFSLDGRAVFMLHGADGIAMIEFSPARQTLIPGTRGFKSLWRLTQTQESRQIFVSGILQTARGTECGTYAISGVDGEPPRALLAGAFPECGGGGGAVSPDGTEVLGSSGGNLCRINLKDGTVDVVAGVGGLGRGDVAWFRKVAWSPDGRWIVALANGRIVLINAQERSRPKDLGVSGSGTVSWSPDSKYLLLNKRCRAFFGYFESLETLDGGTRWRSEIKNSQCKIGGGWIGWIDQRILNGLR